MDRINGADTHNIGQGRRGFKDENVVAGTAGTEVTAAFLNSLQEEVIKVIEAAGLELDPNDWTQLFQAIGIMIDDAFSNIQDDDTFLSVENVQDIVGEFFSGQGATIIYDDAGNALRIEIQYATNSETIAGTVGNKAVTPAGLNARKATRSKTGLVELATDSEAAGRTDEDRAVTPKNLAQFAMLSGDRFTGAVLVGDENEGFARISKGNTDRSGFFECFMPDGTRAGYMGYASDTSIPVSAFGGRSFNFNVTPKVASRDIWHDGNATSLFAANGYQKLPSGLHIQWGRITGVTLNQTYHSVIFPISFPTRCVNVQSSVYRNNVISGTVATLTKSVTQNGCLIAGDHDTNSSTGDIYYTAIGY